VLALSTDLELPDEAVDYGSQHGFAVGRMSVGDGVTWSSGVAVRSAG